MSGINSSLRLQTVLCASGSVAPTVGNAIYGGNSYSAGTLALTSVADISNPTGWTDLISITGKGRLSIASVAASNSCALRIAVDSGEDAGDALRYQIVRDGVTIADGTATRDAGGDRTSDVYNRQGVGSDAGSFLPLEIEFEESLVIRACQKGTFANADSILQLGSAFLETLE